MEINGLSLQLLRIISHFHEPTKDAHLISRIRADFTRADFDHSLDTLAGKQWIAMGDNRTVSLTDGGKQFLKDFDQYNAEFVFDGEYQFAVLKFLHDMDDCVRADDFPEVLINHAPQRQGYPGAHQLMDYLEFDSEMRSYVTKQGVCYRLNDMGNQKYAYFAKRLLPPTPPPIPGSKPNKPTIEPIPMAKNSVKPTKPLVFIGSSKEGLDILNAIVSNLQYDCEFVPWDVGLFGASEYPLESLLNALVENRPDFAIFVLSGEDQLVSRDVQYRTPRDNVIFELGLAIGSISRHRVFMVMDRETKVKLPSDLFGVTPVEFAIPQRTKLIAGLKPACLELKAKIEELGLLTDQKIEEKKSEIEHYKDRAKGFDDITSVTIADENERVKAKERIGSSLGEYVTRHELSRSDIANLYSEGALVGLLYSIITNPIATDAALLIKIHSRLKQPFSWFVLVDAVSALLSKRLILGTDRNTFLDMLKELYHHGHVNLQKKIAGLWPKLRGFDAIQYLSLQKGNLMLNQNIRYFTGKVNLSDFEDSFYGKTLISEGTFRETAIDISVDFNGQQVKELSYTYYLHGEFVFYALVRIQERAKGTREVWFAFRTDITAVAEVSKEEMRIPVTALEEINGWHRVDVNLVTTTELAFPALGYIYMNIVKVRVRGPGKIADLIIR